MIPVVVEILGDVYPEMQLKLADIFAILRNEEEIINALRSSCGHEVKAILVEHRSAGDIIDESDFFDNIGLLAAFKDFQEAKAGFAIRNVFPDEYVKRLYGTFGLDEDLIRRLGRLNNVQLPETSFQRAKTQLTKTGKDVSLRKANDLETRVDGEEGIMQLITDSFPETDDAGKYDFIYRTDSSSFAVDPVKTSILGIVLNGTLVKEITNTVRPNDEVSIIVERSNFYCESGGQEHDTGKIITSNGVAMDVSKVVSLNGRVLHVVKNMILGDEKLSVGNSVRLLVDSDRRTANTRHHTGTHLLNMAVRQVMKTVVYQKSSSVKEEGLRMELGIIGSHRMDREHINQIEAQIRDLVVQGCPVITKVMQYDDIGRRTDIVTVPGEIYPEENLRLVSIESAPLKSLELCCGTHVKNVSQMKEFCITNVKLVSRGTYQITALAGEAASYAVSLGRKMKRDVETIKLDLDVGKLQIENMDSRVYRLKSILQQGFQKNFTIPYVTKTECLEVLDEINKAIRDVTRETLKEFIEIEMKSVLQEQGTRATPFVVHNLTSSALMEDVKLQKATRLCTDRPILVMCVSGGQLKARACVPESFVTDKFNAQVWLEKVAEIFKASVAPPKGQNATLVCNMKGIKVKTSMVEEQLEEALNQARRFAEENL